MAGLFGESSDQKKALGTLGDISSFGTSSGTSDIGLSDNFWKGILQGGPEAEKVLAPQIGAIKEGAQQNKKTAAEFGTRSGGTAAANQMTDDNTRKSIDTMISTLTGQAASELGSHGTSLLNLGESAAGREGSLATEIQRDKMSALSGLGSSLGSLGAGIVTPGLSKWFSSFMGQGGEA
jgi:hypothetical protein